MTWPNPAPLPNPPRDTVPPWHAHYCQRCGRPADPHLYDLDGSWCTPACRAEDREHAREAVPV